MTPFEWIAVISLVVSASMGVYAYVQMKDAPRGMDQSTEPKVPQVEEGRMIGVIFGRVKLTSPNVYAWGDLRGDAIKK